MRECNNHSEECGCCSEDGCRLDYYSGEKAFENKNDGIKGELSEKNVVLTSEREFCFISRVPTGLSHKIKTTNQH